MHPCATVPTVQKVSTVSHGSGPLGKGNAMVDMVQSRLDEAPNLVAGRRHAGGDRYEIKNPARFDETVGFAYGASPAVLEEALDGGEEAAASWAATPLDERMQRLEEAANELQRRSLDSGWAEMLTREQGKVLSESTLEVTLGGGLVGETLAQAHEALDDQIFEDSAGRRVCTYDPVGLTTVITPWNWPVVLSVMKVTPALLAGNPVILKPAPNTPLVITEMMSVLASHLPAGVLSVLQGGAEVGAALVSDPRVRRVSFTGSIATGRRVYAAAASTVKNITLELGGNDPAVILEDADLSPAVIDSMLDAMFITTGQVCMAIKRIYVHESRFSELRDALARAGDRFVVGDGLDPTATLGPLNNKMQFDRVTRLTAAAKDSGAELIPLGHRSQGLEFDKGYFMMPALATGIDESVELVAEEQFGPIVPILPFRDDDEAVRRANDTEYGLCSSVWSSDEDRAFEVARRLQSGIGWVNQHGLAGLDFMLSGGGVKQSGFGREGGVDGMRGFTNERYITSR